MLKMICDNKWCKNDEQIINEIQIKMPSSIQLYPSMMALPENNVKSNRMGFVKAKIEDESKILNLMTV